jgi:hypothetical protein
MAAEIEHLHSAAAMVKRALFDKNNAFASDRVDFLPPQELQKLLNADPHVCRTR